ncbi:MAG: tRNA epoxyqueuosine(34) reductase QueG [Ignavibacteriae bacterium]|nr:tRNA epoxyqueuosine(34) reductase QueG [Ignavibacteriota bacterium]MCB9214822.1 tRNA epoxyqueuosine(34) reductase QueG [Ignavibacteria bacterium]
MLDKGTITEEIRRYAKEELGFDLIGFTPAERLTEEGAQLEEWLARGYNGSMEWLERDPNRRTDPREVLPSARSVIVVAKNYYTPYQHSEEPSHVKVSRYAWGRDYHRILPKKLKKLHQHIIALAPDAENRWYVDAGPVMEKAWAVRAGLGWLGKHSNVITRSHGSWVFLGVMLTSLELLYTNPIPDFCGSCTRCIDACPTDAITQPYLVDANRCISYVTIEQKPKEPLDPEFAATFDRWVFGCDICQEVCPWNKFQQPTDEPDFAPRPGRLDLTFDQIAAMTDEEFEERFRGSPIMRTKLEGLQRNGKGGENSKGKIQNSKGGAI